MHAHKLAASRFHESCCLNDSGGHVSQGELRYAVVKKNP